jgi:hypothetical protein
VSRSDGFGPFMTLNVLRSTAAAVVLVLGCPGRRARSAQKHRSEDPVASSERLREERNVASLSNWSLHTLTHRREIRSLASAFVGEIAAILHLIETHDVVSMLKKARPLKPPSHPILPAGQKRRMVDQRKV